MRNIVARLSSFSATSFSRHAFFMEAKVFSPLAVRRMHDLDFCVILVITLMTTYFHRDEKNDEYLRRYNDGVS